MSWEENNLRDYVGKKEFYDIMGAIQFSVLLREGLREKHSLLDIGCGSLRAGRFFMMFLNENNYYGIEPNNWLVDEAIKEEVGEDLLLIKKPSFNCNGEFKLNVFEKDDFDFILAHSIFSHAALFQIDKCISEVSEILSGKGKFIFTFRHTANKEEENKSEEWTYPGGVNYMLFTIRSVLKKYRMNCHVMNVKSPGGQIWIKAERSK